KAGTPESPSNVFSRANRIATSICLSVVHSGTNSDRAGRENGARVFRLLPESKLSGHRKPERDEEHGSAGDESQLCRIPGGTRLCLQRKQRGKQHEKRNGANPDAVEQPPADSLGGVIDSRQVVARLP